MIDCVRTSSPSQTSSCVIASGGIWLFCREDLVDVEVLPHSSQALNVIIRRVSEIDCLFTAIYANPNPASREELWEYLHCKVCPELSKCHGWLLGISIKWRPVMRRGSLSSLIIYLQMEAQSLWNLTSIAPPTVPHKWPFACWIKTPFLRSCTELYLMPSGKANSLVLRFLYCLPVSLIILPWSLSWRICLRSRT